MPSYSSPTSELTCASLFLPRTSSEAIFSNSSKRSTSTLIVLSAFLFRKAFVVSFTGSSFFSGSSFFRSSFVSTETADFSSGSGLFELSLFPASLLSGASCSCSSLSRSSVSTSTVSSIGMFSFNCVSIVTRSSLILSYAINIPSIISADKTASPFLSLLSISSHLWVTCVSLSSPKKPEVPFIVWNDLKTSLRSSVSLGLFSSSIRLRSSFSRISLVSTIKLSTISFISGSPSIEY